MKQLRVSLLWLTCCLLIVAGGFISAPVQAGVLTDHYENKQVDWLLRGQAYAPPATHHMALGTNTCSDAGVPAEPSGNGYARIAVAASMANWAGTQGAGTTTASSGASGTTSNNNAITWSATSGPWNTLQSVWFMDAATAGNALICINLTAPLNVSGAGFTVSFPAAALSIQVDN